jgi:hypothetical protein
LKYSLPTAFGVAVGKERIFFAKFLLCFKCRCYLFAKFHLNFILPCQIPVFPLHDSCIIFIHYRFGQSFRCSPSSSTYIWLSAWHNWSCSSYQWYYAVINLVLCSPKFGSLTELLLVTI